LTAREAALEKLLKENKNQHLRVEKADRFLTSRGTSLEMKVYGHIHYKDQALLTLSIIITNAIIKIGSKDQALLTNATLSMSLQSRERNVISQRLKISKEWGSRTLGVVPNLFPRLKI